MGQLAAVKRNLLRYVIQVTPEQQVIKQVWFDLDKILIAAVLGFILGTGGHFLVYYVLNRDRRLRLLEREGKRHKFWKDLFEAQPFCRNQPGIPNTTLKKSPGLASKSFSGPTKRG